MTERHPPTSRRDHRAPRSPLLLLLLALVATVLMPRTAWAAPEGPCDIVARVGTPCSAAHSTTRLMRSDYTGPLYQVTRDDNKKTLNVGAFSDGIANTAPQDTFCAGTTCRITRLYDQARHSVDIQGGNDLTPGRGSNTIPQADLGAVANALPIKLKGHRVYGILTGPGIGYRNVDATATTPGRTRDIAVDAQPETVVMVSSALGANDECCFNYGNAEKIIKDNGAAHMNAVNLSFGCNPDNKDKVCVGPGPWVQADLEDGLFMSDKWGNSTLSYRGETATFVTALLKNEGQTFWTLKSGDAQRATKLTFIFKGALPVTKYGNYKPSRKEGGIVLGLGGDNSRGGSGRFFEGYMTIGATPSDTDDVVQANIQALGYSL